MSRLEPENNAEAVALAYRGVRTEKPLVLVGDAPYAASYIARVRAAADSRVILPGAIYGEGYRQLLAHAAAYVQATEVGGTHPALVEALGYGRVVCYNATPENEEVAAGAGLAFDAQRPETLARLLQAIFDRALVEEREASGAGSRILGRGEMKSRKRGLERRGPDPRSVGRPAVERKGILSRGNLGPGCRR